MDPKHLEDNFEALIKDIHSVKPKRPGDFIRRQYCIVYSNIQTVHINFIFNFRCLLVSPPCSEKLKVDHNVYIGQQTKEEDEEEIEEETETRATA